MLSNTILDLLKLAFQFSYRVYSGVMGTVLFSVTELLWLPWDKRISEPNSRSTASNYQYKGLYNMYFENTHNLFFQFYFLIAFVFTI